MEKRNRIAVIGAGVSGIASAIELSKQFQVDIYEAAPVPGGRISSFKDNFTGEVIDNGQHICVGAYEYFFKLLKELGTDKDFKVFDKSDISYFHKDGFNSKLNSKIFTGRTGLLESLLSDKQLSFKEKFSAIRFSMKVISGKVKTDFNSVYELLKYYKQPQKIIDILWVPIAVSTMNTKIDEGDPKMFIKVLRDSFLASGNKGTIFIPDTDLHSLIAPAEEILKGRGSQLKLSNPVSSITYSDEKFIVKSKNGGEAYDKVILALPALYIKRILDIEGIDIEVPEYSSILSIYFWTENELFEDEIISFPGYSFDWIFNRNKLLKKLSHNYHSYQITISAADEYISMKEDDIINLIKSELEEVLKKEFNIVHQKIVREKLATFKADKVNNKKRPKSMKLMEGLYLAGDWLDNGYPSTLEGAAMNGFNVGESLKSGI